MICERYDTVIIGSGIAGALMGWRLAGEKLRVLLLEAGEADADRLEFLGRYASAANKTPHSPFRSLDNDRFAASPDSPTDYYDQGSSEGIHLYKSTYERRLGGSTWHWLGHTPRLVPNDFRMRSTYDVGVDWPIDYDDLEPWYGEAEAAIGVAGDDKEWQELLGAHRSRPFPMSKVWPSYSDLKVAEALGDFRIEGIPLKIISTPSGRNTQPYDGRPVCAGNASCVPLCPIGAKYDATVHVRKSQDAGATVRTRAVVTRLNVDGEGRVTEVVYRTWDGMEHRVAGAVVVLAAHAIETPKILLASAQERAPHGVANSSDQVGRNLMDHLQKNGWADTAAPMYPFRGPPSTSGIEELRDGDFRKTRGAFHLSLGNDGRSRQSGLLAPYGNLFELVGRRGLIGSALQAALAASVQRQLRLSCSVEVLPRASNRVTLSDSVDELGIARPRLQFAIDDYTQLGLDFAIRVFGGIFDRIGATNPVFESQPAQYSGAGHIMGTCRMGVDPRDSVVDKDCRAHDSPNLFIVGSSVFPTCGTANPTLTVAALALRAVEPVKAAVSAFRAAAPP